MLLKLFRSNRSLVTLILPLFIIAIWLPGLLKQQALIFPVGQHPGLFQKICLGFTAKNVMLSKIIALFFFFIISIMIVRLNTRYFIIPSRTQLPAVIYMFIVSSDVTLHKFSPVILSCLFLVLAVNRVFASYKYEGVAYHFFDAALLISLSSLIYINALFFISFVWLGLILLRTFKWREWIFTIIGLVLPYLFLSVYFYGTDRSIKESLFYAISNNFEDRIPFTDKIAGIYIIVIVLSVFIIISSLFMMHKFDTKKIHARKYFLFFFWMFIILILLFILLPSYGGEYILFAAIPLTFLLSHYFIFTKINFINRILFTILLLMPFYMVYSDMIYDLIKK